VIPTFTIWAETALTGNESITLRMAVRLSRTDLQPIRQPAVGLNDKPSADRQREEIPDPLIAGRVGGQADRDAGGGFWLPLGEQSR